MILVQEMKECGQCHYTVYHDGVVWGLVSEWVCKRCGYETIGEGYHGR